MFGRKRRPQPYKRTRIVMRSGALVALEFSSHESYGKFRTAVRNGVSQMQCYTGQDSQGVWLRPCDVEVL